jgi:hypothetical protein
MERIGPLCGGRYGGGWARGLGGKSSSLLIEFLFVLGLRERETTAGQLHGMVIRGGQSAELTGW